jgi:L-Lysine epsilon oxidase N-terminal/L-lysine epsilon oxidase C-terminal domain
MPSLFEIHPAIGIARVGNSDASFVFDGPSSSNLRRRDPASGKLLRQAAEFRIYKCDRDAAGKLVSAQEITNADADIVWSVQVANRKATGRRFLSGGAGRRNNATGDDNADRKFIIDSGQQSVANPGETKDLAGTFDGLSVTLGKISFASNGRLTFVGGEGVAASPTNRPIINFADNDGWFDTISDGAILARVTPKGGQAVDALPAWVIVAPPDYAPGITNLVTLYDVLVDTAIKRGIVQSPQTIVFSRHVRPILERAMAYQWVTRAARLGYDDSLSGGHSTGGPGDFAGVMAQLGDPAAPNTRRAHIFHFLRDPDSPAHAPNLTSMPRLNDDDDSGDVFALTRTQYSAMLLWSQGKFVKEAPAENESEPERLTRVALESCAGGPFFPGIEAGRIMRDVSRYMDGDPFRLSPDKVKPGEITQNNAVPWQADFHLCRWEETDGTSVKRLGWWPAQRPDDVLKDKNADPVPWTRGVADTFKGMIDNWHRLGFVKEDTANAGVFIEQERDPTLPDTGVA